MKKLFLLFDRLTSDYFRIVPKIRGIGATIMIVIFALAWAFGFYDQGEGEPDAKTGAGAAVTIPSATLKGAMANFVPTARTDGSSGANSAASGIFVPPEASFVDGDGRRLGFSQFSGKTTLVNLWATWCAPCREEMPSLARLQRLLGGDAFGVVAVSVDIGDDAPARRFLVDIGAEDLSFHHDASGRLGFTLGLRGLPASVLLDRHGRIVGTMSGPADWSSPEAVALIRAVLDAAS